MSRPRAHIAGVGETRYTRWGKIGDVTEHALACQAIQNAVADAGLSIDDVDGLASFAEDRNEAVFLAAELGLPALRFANMVWMPGGGGGCAAVANAAMAVETGQAEVVVVYRSLCQGQFFRFGTGGHGRFAPRVDPKPPTRAAGQLADAGLDGLRDALRADHGRRGLRAADAPAHASLRNHERAARPDRGDLPRAREPQPARRDGRHGR